MNRILLLFFCLGFILLTGCNKPTPAEAPTSSSPEASPTPVKVLNVGVFLPLKGIASEAGQSALNGLILAAEEATANGGIHGQPIRIVVRDTKSEPDKAETAVQDLVKEDEAVALIGGISSGTTEAIKAADSAGIPVLILGSTMPGKPDKEPWVFRLCDVDFFSGQVMAKFASTLNSSRSIVLYNSEDNYARTLAMDFGKQFKKKRGTQIAGEPYTANTQNYSKQLTMIKKKNPEVVYLPAPATEAADIIKQARAMGLMMPFLGTALWDSKEFLELVGRVANDCYLPGRFGYGGDAKVNAFITAYTTKYNTMPDCMAALGYDAMWTLIQGLLRTESTNATKLRKTLRGIKNFHGITGQITLNPESLEPRPVPVLKVGEDGFSYLETITP